MVREYYRKICERKEVRANLIALRSELKSEEGKKLLAYEMGGEFEPFAGLLEDPDPKIRKNAARILGSMESEDVLPILFAAYRKEETRFIRADYLKAMLDLDYSAYRKELEERLDLLRTMKPKPEEQKHRAEEMRILQSMILKYQKRPQHRFVGQRAKTEVILVTNRCQRQVTAGQIKKGKITMLAGGVRIREAELKEILAVRTWSELLFPVEADSLCVEKPQEVGRQLSGVVLEKLRAMHRGEDPFLYRIELRGRLEQDKKGGYIRRISDALEQESGGMLINSVTGYEVEIRLLEKKDGTYAAMLKLFTLPDKRFLYRREHLAASIHPVNAAVAAQIALPYLKEGAQILDPFCGVGTMLIERNHAVSAGVMYGIDLYGEAIEKARSNTDRDGSRIYYINKDFFAFEHAYRFDEIITNMPQVTASKSKEEIRDIYMRLFEKAKTILADKAVLVLYATEPQFAEEAVKQQSEYRLVCREIMNEKNQTSVLVYKYQREE